MCPLSYPLLKKSCSLARKSTGSDVSSVVNVDFILSPLSPYRGLAKRGEREVFCRLSKIHHFSARAHGENACHRTHVGCPRRLSYVAVYTLRTKRSSTGPSRTQSWCMENLMSTLSFAANKIEISGQSCQSPRIMFDKNRNPIGILWLFNPPFWPHASMMSLYSYSLIDKSSPKVLITPEAPDHLHHSIVLTCRLGSASGPDWGRDLVKIISIQTKPGLQTWTISCTLTSQLDR